MADEPTEPTESPQDSGLRGRDLIGLGGLLAGAVVAFTVLGILLDRATGNGPVFTMVGVFAGMVAGSLGFWARVRQAIG
jgi:F0F1-type ATP synthase assembly protein I